MVSTSKTFCIGCVLSLALIHTVTSFKDGHIEADESNLLMKIIRLQTESEFFSILKLILRQTKVFKLLITKNVCAILIVFLELITEFEKNKICSAAMLQK